MCSIEEAWAGQTFEGHKVQSQADLHRKYMPFADNLLERNNEFSIGRNEPQSREGTRGLNSKMSREPRVPNVVRNVSEEAQVNYSSTMPTSSNYGGLEPRPSYMSIYDNADNTPQPSMASRENFNDINQAYNVSDTVTHFMNQRQPETHNNYSSTNSSSNSSTNSSTNSSSNSANSFTNHLLNEDNEIDRMILQKKLNNLNSNSENFNNTNFNNTNFNNTNFNNNDNKNTMQPPQQQTLQFQQALQDIIHRLDRLERDMHNNNTRNMYDMVLYILVGILIAFIIYTILR